MPKGLIRSRSRAPQGREPGASRLRIPFNDFALNFPDGDGNFDQVEFRTLYEFPPGAHRVLLASYDLTISKPATSTGIIDAWTGAVSFGATNFGPDVEEFETFCFGDIFDLTASDGVASASAVGVGIGPLLSDGLAVFLNFKLANASISTANQVLLLNGYLELSYISLPGNPPDFG